MWIRRYFCLIRGDWTGISNVDFGTGDKSIYINAGSKNWATIRISLDSPSGEVIVLQEKFSDMFLFPIL